MRGEKTFPIPRADSFNEPAGIERKYLMIRDAMLDGDLKTVGNHQLRLLKAGLEIPITLTDVNNILEKYDNDA